MKHSSSLFKFIAIALLFIIAISYLMYWLWQRQPKPQDNNQIESPIVQSDNQEEKLDNTSLLITPESGTILKDVTNTLSIKTSPNEFVIIYSNFSQGVGKTDQNGELQVEIELEEGLNLINVSTLNKNLESTQSQSLAYFVSQSTDASSFFAGSVKSIFDEVITITTISDEQTIRQKTSTKLILPSNETDAEDNGIRVGDYVIAQGKIENEKDFSVTSLEIIRQNKPQNEEKHAAGITLSEITNGLFSIRDPESKIIEFAVDDFTTISQNGNGLDFDNIIKDQRVIVIYFIKDNENIVDLIYLLP